MNRRLLIWSLINLDESLSLMISTELITGKHTNAIKDYIRSNPNLIYNNSKYINLVSKHLNAQFTWLIAKRGYC